MSLNWPSGSAAFSHFAVLAATFLHQAVATHSLQIVEINQNVGPCSVCNVLQHLHVFRLGPAASLVGIWRGVVRVIHHVVLCVVAIAIEVEVLELVGGLGGRRLEVLEKVDEGGWRGAC